MSRAESGRLVVEESPSEFFRNLVTDVLAHRKLEVQGETEWYLVQLLAQRVGRGEPGVAPEEEPLALQLLRALEAGHALRRDGLRRVGDTSLFVAGFFGDSLARSPVSPGYYVAIGGQAYQALADSPGPAAGAAVFGEMAERFEDLVDVLAEIAEMQDLRSNRGLVRLYERFLHTGSRRVAEMLRARGVALFAGPGDARFRN